MTILKVHEYHDDSGQLIYFEVSNTHLSQNAACDLVAAIPNVRIIFRPRRFTLTKDDVFCKFTLGGKAFELFEPFGDNSRFHVAANPAEACAELEILKVSFHNVSWLF